MKAMPKLEGRRNAQLVRILRILGDLDRLGGVGLDELASRYGATTRTIRRDFNALEEAGFPLEQQHGDGETRWMLRWPARKAAELRSLNAEHFLALKAAESQSSVARSVPALMASIEDLAEKIERAVGPRGRQQLADIDACFYSYDKYVYEQAPRDTLWPLITAICERRLCRISYKSPRRRGQATNFDILPLKMFVHHSAPYLMAHILKYDAVGSLNLQRFVTLEVLAQRAEAPEQFHPKLLEDAAFGVWVDGPPTTYSFQFDAEIAPYIKERRWHPTQQMCDLKDGGLHVTFNCHASVEVEAWVASWRHHVTVLAPESLRMALSASAALLCARYTPALQGGG